MTLLRPWLLSPPPALVHQVLEEPQARLLDLLHLRHALYLTVAQGPVTSAEIERLADAGLIYLYPGLRGPLVILGPAGRLRLGRSPRTRMTADSAENHAFAAWALQHLEARDYRSAGLVHRGMHRLTHPARDDLLMCARARGHSARSLRRLIRRHEWDLYRQDMWLLVVTPDRRRTRFLHHPRVMVEVLRAPGVRSVRTTTPHV
jgi:hypothetical protein